MSLGGGTVCHNIAVHADHSKALYTWNAWTRYQKATPAVPLHDLLPPNETYLVGHPGSK